MILDSALTERRSHSAHQAAKPNTRCRTLAVAQRTLAVAQRTLAVAQRTSAVAQRTLG
jgi:hypothetical protein